MDALLRFFVNPSFLWLGGLAALPILIYLLNRHRFQRRMWAAMTFLIRALEKNRRRLQVQDLILLAIRVLAVLLLALAVARPVLRQSPLGIARGSQQNWIFVLDTSYSMGFREGSTSLFDQARETMARVADSLLQDGDTAALMTLAHEPEIVVGRTPVSPELRRLLSREVADIALTARALRLLPSLRLLDELCGQFSGPTGEPEPCRIVVFSDLQRRDWLNEAGDAPAASEAREIIDGIRGRGGEFAVASLSSSDSRSNVVVKSVSLHPEVVARDVPASVSVTLENHGDEDAQNLDLAIRVRNAESIDPDAAEDGEAQLGEVLAIPAHGVVTRQLPYRFDSAGFYTIAAEVRSDGLVTDNRRNLVVSVSDDVRVCIVDGDPAIEAAESESFFLQLALEPRDDDLGTLGGRFTPFLPDLRTIDQIDGDWKPYSVVILANVSDLPLDALASLERYVAGGGALVGFLGANVREDFYNEHLHRDGAGLLPLPLLGRRGDPRTPVYMQFSDAEHPVARYFQDHESMSYLQPGGVVSFYQYFQVAAPKESSPVSVLCRYNDLDRSPAIFDAPYGRGRVLWVTSTADREWNELPVWQDYVVFLHEAISYLVGFGSRSLNLSVGETFQRRYGSDAFASEVMLRSPVQESSDLAGPRLLRLAMREVEEGQRFELSFEDTSAPGLYRLDLKRSSAGRADSVEYFAVNVDTAEGDLRAMAPADFEQHYGFRPEPFDATERFRDLARQRDLLRGKEYWRWICASLLLVLLVETALAQIFGRKVR